MNQALSIQPVILCGGSGTRLWPLSRSNYPKPFIALTGQETLFQQACNRVTGPAFLAPVIVSAEAQRFLVLDQLPSPAAALILEPTARNTGPACLLAALWATAHTGPQTVLAFLPADHVIPDPAAFRSLLQQGAGLAQQGQIVLFGITPTGPNPDYGYIQSLVAKPGQGQKVTEFIEKPGLPKARQLIEEGNHYWNSGIFMARADVMLAELNAFRPEMLAICQKAMQSGTVESGFATPLVRPGAMFTTAPSEAIDKALHELTSNATMLPYSGRWNDVGNWDAVLSELPLDAAGNSLQGNVVTHEVTNSLVKAEGGNGKVTAVIGLSNVVVVDTPDALVITTREKAAHIKDVVGQLKNTPEVTDHRRVQRPWGWYETLEKGPGFLVKRIQVKPGAKLSLQYHHHRAEHWVCIRGTCTVTKGEETLELKPDQSIYLPQGIQHRLANLTAEPIEIIEVQTGSLLEESDIVRLEDTYGRAPSAAQ